MTLSISKTVSESVSVSDSAKSASVVTDSSGSVWDLANTAILTVISGTSGAVLQMSDGTQFSPPGVSFATAKTAWLATRS